MRLRGHCGLVVGFVLLGPVAAQDLPPEVLTLARAKQHMRDVMSRLPDYTCQETFQRFRRPAGQASQFRKYDTVRLEILYTGGVELFAPPGAGGFTPQSNVSAFAMDGLMGNGLFALALRSALLGRNAIITYAGEEEREGRSAANYDFTISPFWRPFTISHQGATGTTGLQGSFWIDPVTLDILRLESHATEIPPALFVTSASTTVNYALARIGSQEVLLPQSGEMYLGAINGEANRVAVEFANCRSYQAKSSVRFDDESAPLAAPPQPAARPTGKP